MSVSTCGNVENRNLTSAACIVSSCISSLTEIVHSCHPSFLALNYVTNLQPEFAFRVGHELEADMKACFLCVT